MEHVGSELVVAGTEAKYGNLFTARETIVTVTVCVLRVVFCPLASIVRTDGCFDFIINNRSRDQSEVVAHLL